MSYSTLSHLECARCDDQWPADVSTKLCDCGSPLLARYKLDSVATTPAVLADRMPSLWRYHELLPVRSADTVVTSGEGMTPLLPLPRLGQTVGPATLAADLALAGRLEGLFLSPEGAATVTAVRLLRRTGWLDSDDEWSFSTLAWFHCPMVPGSG